MNRLLIICIITCLFSCNKENNDFKEYVSLIKQSKFIQKYKGYRNMYTRNCIFLYSDPTGIEVVYKINEDKKIDIIKSSLNKNLLDTTFITSEIYEMLNEQKKNNIAGFNSSKDRFSIYFNLDKVDNYIIEVKDDKMSKNGVLVMFSNEIDVPMILKEYSTDLIKIDSNTYTYLSPILENSQNCW